MSDTPLTLRNGPTAIPSDRCWFDPQLLNVATSIQLTDVTLTMNTIAAVAKPNVRRWGIGFSVGAFVTGLKLSPWPDCTAFPMLQASLAGDVPFWTLHDHGTLVSSGWWGFSSATGVLRVVELIRN